MVDTTVKDAILQGILPGAVRLADLKFGSAEAEVDELLDQTFIGSKTLEEILNQQKSIVIGDRGSGKSAMFRKLAEGTCSGSNQESVEVFAETKIGDILHRIVDKDAWLDPETLRAASLVVVAAIVASAIPTSASKKLRRDSRDLRAGLGFPTEQKGRARRVVDFAFRLLGGTTFKFAVGPVNLEAKLPPGSSSKAARSAVDVEAFLLNADKLLGESSKRVVVMLDRIDETFSADTKEAGIARAGAAASRGPRIDAQKHPACRLPLNNCLLSCTIYKKKTKWCRECSQSHGQRKNGNKFSSTAF